MPATKSKIITLPNAHLRQKSSRVAVIDDNVKTIIEQMKEATLDWEASRQHELGVALAAVQIDELIRVVVIRNDFENKDDKSFSVFINPQITKLEGEVEEDYEGCLSVRSIYGKVPRYNKVRVRALDENGAEIRIKAKDFLARVFQHEVDHTNGIVFVDHIKDKPEAFFELTDDGKLVKMDYEQVKQAGVLR